MLDIALTPVPTGAAPVRHKGRRWQPNCNMHSNAISPRRSSEPSVKVNSSDASSLTQMIHLSGPIDGILVFSNELRKSNPTRKKNGENKRERRKHLFCFSETFCQLHKVWSLLGLVPIFFQKSRYRRAKCCGCGRATFRPPQNEPQLKPLKLGHVIIVASPAVATGLPKKI